MDKTDQLVSPTRQRFNPNYDWEQYLNFTEKTALLDDGQYYIAGLLSEVGEVAGIFKRILRGDYEESTPASHSELMKKLQYEFGDILWYIVRLYCWYDRQNQFLIDLAYIQTNLLHKLPARRFLSDFQNIECLYEIVRPLALMIVVGDLSEESELEDELPTALEYFYRLILPYVSIEQVANLNIDKLSLRLESGTLRGTGDNR